MPKNVLVVDDDLVQRRALEETISASVTLSRQSTPGKGSHHSRPHASGASRSSSSTPVALRTGGMAVLSALRSLSRRYPAIVLTADGNIEAAMAAMGAGAVDFVVKPVSPERLEVSIKNAPDRCA